MHARGRPYSTAPYFFRVFDPSPFTNCHTFLNPPLPIERDIHVLYGRSLNESVSGYASEGHIETEKQMEKTRLTRIYFTRFLGNFSVENNLTRRAADGDRETILRHRDHISSLEQDPCGKQRPVPAVFARKAEQKQRRRRGK